MKILTQYSLLVPKLDLDVSFRMGKRSSRDETETKKSAHDLRTGYIGSRLRSPSGRVK